MKGCVIRFKGNSVNPGYSLDGRYKYYVQAKGRCVEEGCTMQYWFELNSIPKKQDARFTVK
jgi:hypothetical protein